MIINKDQINSLKEKIESFHLGAAKTAVLVRYLRILIQNEILEFSNAVYFLGRLKERASEKEFVSGEQNDSDRIYEKILDFVDEILTIWKYLEDIESRISEEKTVKEGKFSSKNQIRSEFKRMSGYCRFEELSEYLFGRVLKVSEQNKGLIDELDFFNSVSRKEKTKIAFK